MFQLTSLCGNGPLLALISWFVFNIYDALIKNLLLTHSFVPVTIVAQTGVLLCALAALYNKGQIGKLWHCKRWLVGLYSSFSALTVISFFYAMPYVPFADLFIFALMRPACALVFSRIFLKEKLSKLQMAGFTLALLAISLDLQIWHGFDFGHFAQYPPDALLALMLHVLLGSSGPLLIRRFGVGENPLVITGVSSFLTIILLPILFVAPINYGDFIVTDWLQILLAGPVYFIAWQFYVRGFQIGPAGLAAGTQYSQMVWTTLIGWLIFSEIPSFYTLLSAAMIIGSGVLLFYPQKLPKAAQ